jgi:HEAT repeat protein
MALIRLPKRRSASSVQDASVPDPRAPAFADLYNQFIAADDVAKTHATEPKASLQTWIERLYSGDPQLQEQAAKVLGQSRNPSAIGPLRDALTAKDASLRAAAALALGSLRTDRAVGDLITLLADGNSMVREAAAQALGAIAHPQAIPALQEAAAKDAKSKVRKAAKEALDAIAARRK